MFLASMKFKEELERVAVEDNTLTEQPLMSPNNFSNFGS
jgi:hypothetical protein